MIRVLQWNILADCHSGADPHLGGFTHEGVSLETLGWERREGMILDVLRQSGADLICLQEVDHPEMMDKLEEMEFVFHKRAGKKHGIVLAWNRERFLNLQIKRVDLEPGQVLLIADLVDRKFKKEFQLMTAHLKAEKTREGELLRTEQMRTILSLVESNCILGLDMNATPGESQSGPSLCYPLARTMFKSACEDVLGHEPNLTTYKKRKDFARHCIDYILVRGGLVPITCLVHNSWPAPNDFYPSDHFHLVVDLLLVKSHS